MEVEKNEEKELLKDNIGTTIESYKVREEKLI